MAQPEIPPSSAIASRMRESAERVLVALPQGQRAKALRPFDDSDRIDWHYTPRSRNGVSLKELDAHGRDAAHALLKTALSAVGYRKVVNIIELELVLREMETLGLMRDPERYHITFYDAPSRTERWGWRFEGHHLSLNFTLAGDRLAVDTPSFFGANPATVPSGPKKGLRTLGDEHDAGWQVLDSLSDAQRREAVISTRTYGDTTSNRAKVDPHQAFRHSRRGSTRAARSGLEDRRALCVEFRARTRGVAPRPRRARRSRKPALRLGGIDHARRAALLSRAGAALPDRIRRLAGWGQSHPHRVARLHGRLRARGLCQRRVRPRPAARPLRVRARNYPPALTHGRRADGRSRRP
jgi:hypothetical protein